MISEIVVAEAAAGDADAARRRAQWIEGVPSLRITGEAAALGRLLIQAARLPKRAAVDALHILSGRMPWNALLADVELHAPRER